MSSELSRIGDLYPFKSRFLDLDGGRYHYVDEGDGEAVVMVHGNPTWSFYYRNLVLALRERYRCIVPDHIGCGLSDKPNDERYPYRVERRVQDLEALLDHLGLHENVTLIVHDWGGMIGCACAVRNPDRIKQIVLLNTAAFLLPKGKQMPWQLSLLRHRNALTSFAVQGLNLFAWCATWMGTHQGLSREVKRGLLLPYDSWDHRRAIARFVQDIPTRRSHPSYAFTKWVDENLDVLRDKPILICWGLRDFVFDADFLAEWRRRFPVAEVHAFEDAGHYVLEDRTQEIVELIKRFMLGRHSEISRLPSTAVSGMAS